MIFRRTTLRLTLIFAAVQLLLLAAFALAIYFFVVGTFDYDTAETDGTLSGAEQGFAQLRRGLLVAYGALVVLVPLASYGMARVALRPLRRSYEAQQSFVDGASHEMRTPLSVIQGELELALSRPRTPEQYRAAIESSLQAATGLVRLTADLLLLSRDETEVLRTSFELLDLRELAREAVASRPESPLLRMDLPRLPDPRMPDDSDEAVMTLGSRELLRRAVDNLLDNAEKFTDEGSISLKVSVVNGHAVVSVIDTGVGMTREETARAFERFWRADSARTRPGHGLGLALVQRIAVAHRGRVQVESRAGMGTSVSLVLPLSP